ncbi:hypothetical protein BJF82_10850 [Kytococcus sp. CUA-901]|nr:hypothetical protein BJF82_10850 [Kytococcus sp. CUA-901]
MQRLALSLGDELGLALAGATGHIGRGEHHRLELGREGLVDAGALAGAGGARVGGRGRRVDGGGAGVRGGALHGRGLAGLLRGGLSEVGSSDGLSSSSLDSDSSLDSSSSLDSDSSEDSLEDWEVLSSPSESSPPQAVRPRVAAAATASRVRAAGRRVMTSPQSVAVGHRRVRWAAASWSACVALGQRIYRLSAPLAAISSICERMRV